MGFNQVLFSPQAGDDMPDPVAVFLFLFFICLTWRKVN